MSVAISSNGITQKTARARRQSRMKRKTMDPMNISELVTSEVTPSVTSWSSASMSLVRRLDDPAGLLAAEEVEAELLQMGEELAPQVVDDVRPHPAREVRLQVAGAKVDEADGDEGDDDPGEDVEVLGDDAAVDRDLEQVRHGEAGERDRDHGDDAERGASPVRVGEASEARELELARQVQEGAPALQFLKAGAGAVRAAVTGRGRHQAALPEPAGPAAPPAARPPPAVASATATSSSSQPSRSASPNRCA